MANSRSNGGGEFFGAVSKNCRTVIVKNSKGEVKHEISHRGVTKNNIAMFKCCSVGENAISKKLLHKPRFKLTRDHHIALCEAGLSFLAQMK